MVELTHLQLRQFSKAIEEVYAPADYAQLHLHFYRVLKRFFAFDYFAYHEIHDDQTQRAIIYPEYPFDLAAFTTYLHQHPSWIAFTKGGAQGVLRITDFVTLANWQHTDLYNLIFRPRNQNHQVGFIDSTSLPSLGIALNRSNQEFSDNECVAFNLLRPHLAQAFQFCYTLGSAGEPIGFPVQGYLEVDATGKIIEINRQAILLLQEYFGLCGSELPATIRSWLNHRQLTFREQFAAGAGGLIVGGNRKTLTVRAISAPFAPKQRIVLRESDEERQSASLREMGLTPRESEVLLWVSRGKQNSEIATILGVHTRTVTTHLERIYAKLGVETRTAASRVVHEISFGNGRKG
jgi:DNA-binding CsgD family transcriptional regulator